MNGCDDVLVVLREAETARQVLEAGAAVVADRPSSASWSRPSSGRPYLLSLFADLMPFGGPVQVRHTRRSEVLEAQRAQRLQPKTLPVIDAIMPTTSLRRVTSG
jgi:hypothetical protein